MKTHTWTCVRIAFILLILLPGGLLSGVRAGSLAEHQTYLPLVQRSSYVPSSGLLDESFGEYGMVVTSFTADTAAGRAIALQPDDKLVVAGSLEVAVNDTAFILVRYNPDGSLDVTFDIDGKVITNPTARSDQINDLVLQEDGKIVVAGSSEDANGHDFALARYNPDGSLDASFDEDGWLSMDISGGDDFAYSVALQEDGKILVAGSAAEPTAYYYDDFALARYNPDGSLDASFGGDGMVQINYGYYEYGRAIALQPDGKIVMGGRVVFPGIGWSFYEFILARLNSDGSLDTSFDEDGWVTTDFSDSGGPEGCEDVLIQPDGKILAGGWANNNSTGFKEFALARYTPEGSLDTSFDGDGMVTTFISTDDYFGEALALQEDGKILLAGYAVLAGSTFGESEFVLARYNSDGSLDGSFDDDGWLTTDFSDYALLSHDLALQPDGKIVLAGETDRGIALARYNPDGSLDNSFDFYGVTVIDLITDSEGGRAVALQPDGMIVVGGFGWNEASGDDFLVARYTPDGSLDSSFDGDGWVSTALSSFKDQIMDVAIQADGKILVVGFSETTDYGLGDFALARYNADGSLDTSFDGDGWLTTDFNGDDDQAHSVALQPDGKIVVAGRLYASIYNYDVALARYNADGSLDTSFDGDGKQTVDFYGYSDAANSVAIQPDGKIVIAGTVSIFSTFPYCDNSIALMRFNPDGSLDASFDADGIVNTDFSTGTGSESAKDLLLLPDGKIVAAGWVNLSGSAGYYLALLRYTPDGALDPSFDGDGWVLTNLLTEQNYAQAVQKQPDGKLVVAGFENISGFPDNESVFFLARFNADGSLDSSFSEDGWLHNDFDGFDDRCYAMLLQPDGKIVLAGESGGDFALARYK